MLYYIIILLLFNVLLMLVGDVAKIRAMAVNMSRWETGRSVGLIKGCILKTQIMTKTGWQ